VADLACLAAVYTMIERERGTAAAMIDGFYRFLDDPSGLRRDCTSRSATVWAGRRPHLRPDGRGS